MAKWRRPRREDYTIGWVCALPVELAAAREMLDEEYEAPDQDANNTNIYTLGRVDEHNVVVVCLPMGKTGTNSAAAVAIQMNSTFTSIQFVLMVGIGGGVPSVEADIRLGDVVVSSPHKQHGGVVQYDFGKATPSGFERTGFLNSPPKILLNAVSNIQANQLVGRSRLLEYLSKLTDLPEFARSNAGPDVLFAAEYDHEGGTTCELCSKEKVIERQSRGQEVVVHYGTIASGNQVMRDGTTRDRKSLELGGVLCFEMEAAGLMDSFPCLVIRGICDYADSHKNKRWQPYAAGTAAAYAKEVLSAISAAPLNIVVEPIEISVKPSLLAKLTGSVGKYITRQFAQYHLVALCILIVIVAAGWMFLRSHIYDQLSQMISDPKPTLLSTTLATEFTDAKTTTVTTPEPSLFGSIIGKKFAEGKLTKDDLFRFLELLSTNTISSKRQLTKELRKLYIKIHPGRRFLCIFELALTLVRYRDFFLHETERDKLYTSLKEAWIMGDTLARRNSQTLLFSFLNVFKT